jgi:uncharacterized protein CbrC (UPF0167 family)
VTTKERPRPLYIGYGHQAVCDYPRCHRLANYTYEGRYYCVPHVEQASGWRIAREVKR